VNPDNDIYLRLIDPLKESMKRSVYRIVQDPDDAADAFQDALFKVWNYLDRIVDHPNPQAYILCICVSSAYDLLRKRIRKTQNEVASLQEEITSSAKIENPCYANEITEIVKQSISSMPLKQAQAVFLRLFEQEPYSVIGSALGCAEETARSHVSKGLALLRLILIDKKVSLSEVHI